MAHELKNTRLAVIGLGYVGLPLAMEFARVLPVVGFDINEKRIEELRHGVDRTLEMEPEAFSEGLDITFTADPQEIAACNVYVVTTPTPVDEHNVPDLTPIMAASTTIGKVLTPGDIVIYESTVYPGATEEKCAPVLTRESGLVLNEDYYLGYSPERINPGDKEHRFPSIVKVTSGSTAEIADFVDALYRLVVHAGTHKAPSIRVAEAAKVIENTQRDVNIALINELAILFNRLGIDTLDVLEAAGTKWNFLPFRPGLVGGHCIGVDPYYLTHKAQEVGYQPEMILAGRRINDNMGEYVATELMKALARKGDRILDAKILVLGLTFKEDTPDLRNTKVTDIISTLESYGMNVDVHDPWCDPAEAREHLGIELTEQVDRGQYAAVVIAVAHREFIEAGADWVRSLTAENGLIYDLKRVLPRGDSDLTL